MYMYIQYIYIYNLIFDDNECICIFNCSFMYMTYDILLL